MEFKLKTTDVNAEKIIYQTDKDEEVIFWAGKKAWTWNISQKQTTPQIAKKLLEQAIEYMFENQSWPETINVK